jgi:hypothetical protein
MRLIPRLILAIATFAAVTANAQKVATLRDFDFDNFTYAWNDASDDKVPMDWKWLTSTPDEHFRAINGMHQFHSFGQDRYERQRSPLISVDSVRYGDLDGDGLEEAVVALNYSTGGTANWNYLYVYKLIRGQAKLLARMRTGSRGSGGLVRAFVRNQLLIADFADPEKRMGDCCSEGFIRVSYRWQDGVFVEDGQRQRETIYVHSTPSRPSFSGYRVKNVYHGKPAQAIITKEFRGFRARIREGAKSSVEFAGHYTIPRWGCGTDCNGFVIVDSITGKVYAGLGVAGLPFSWLEEYGGDDAIPRMEFYSNSRLLEINACPNEKDCGFYDYEMIDGKGLKLLRVEFIPDLGNGTNSR